MLLLIAFMLLIRFLRPISPHTENFLIAYLTHTLTLLTDIFITIESRKDDQMATTAAAPFVSYRMKQIIAKISCTDCVQAPLRFLPQFFPLFRHSKGSNGDRKMWELREIDVQLYNLMMDCESESCEESISERVY